jgi:hypothetical protein
MLLCKGHLPIVGIGALELICIVLTTRSRAMYLPLFRFYILTFERAFIYYVRRDGAWTRHGRVFQSVDTQGQDIRLSEADLIGDKPFGIKPGLKLTVNWTRKGIAPALKWRGLKNGNWENGNGHRATKGVG